MKEKCRAGAMAFGPMVFAIFLLNVLVYGDQVNFKASRTEKLYYKPFNNKTNDLEKILMMPPRTGGGYCVILPNSQDVFEVTVSNDVAIVISISLENKVGYNWPVAGDWAKNLGANQTFTEAADPVIGTTTWQWRLTLQPGEYDFQACSQDAKTYTFIVKRGTSTPWFVSISKNTCDFKSYLFTEKAPQVWEKGIYQEKPAIRVYPTITATIDETHPFSQTLCIIEPTNTSASNFNTAGEFITNTQYSITHTAAGFSHVFEYEKGQTKAEKAGDYAYSTVVASCASVLVEYKPLLPQPVTGITAHLWRPNKRQDELPLPGSYDYFPTQITWSGTTTDETWTQLTVEWKFEKAGTTPLTGTITYPITQAEKASLSKTVDLPPDLVGPLGDYDFTLKFTAPGLEAQPQFYPASGADPIKYHYTHTSPTIGTAFAGPGGGAKPSSIAINSGTKDARTTALLADWTFTSPTGRIIPGATALDEAVVLPQNPPSPTNIAGAWFSLSAWNDIDVWEAGSWTVTFTLKGGEDPTHMVSAPKTLQYTLARSTPGFTGLTLGGMPKPSLEIGPPTSAVVTWNAAINSGALNSTKDAEEKTDYKLVWSIVRLTDNVTVASNSTPLASITPDGAVKTTTVTLVNTDGTEINDMPEFAARTGLHEYKLVTRVSGYVPVLNQFISASNTIIRNFRLMPQPEITFSSAPAQVPGNLAVKFALTADRNNDPLILNTDIQVYAAVKISQSAPAPGDFKLLGTEHFPSDPAVQQITTSDLTHAYTNTDTDLWLHTRVVVVSPSYSVAITPAPQHFQSMSPNMTVALPAGSYAGNLPTSVEITTPIVGDIADYKFNIRCIGVDGNGTQLYSSNPITVQGATAINKVLTWNANGFFPTPQIPSPVAGNHKLRVYAYKGTQLIADNSQQQVPGDEFQFSWNEPVVSGITFPALESQKGPDGTYWFVAPLDELAGNLSLKANIHVTSANAYGGIPVRFVALITEQYEFDENGPPLPANVQQVYFAQVPGSQITTAGTTADLSLAPSKIPNVNGGAAKKWLWIKPYTTYPVVDGPVVIEECNTAQHLTYAVDGAEPSFTLKPGTTIGTGDDLEHSAVFATSEGATACTFEAEPAPNRAPITSYSFGSFVNGQPPAISGWLWDNNAKTASKTLVANAPTTWNQNGPELPSGFYTLQATATNIFGKSNSTPVTKYFQVDAGKPQNVQFTRTIIAYPSESPDTRDNPNFKRTGFKVSIDNFSAEDETKVAFSAEITGLTTPVDFETVPRIATVTYEGVGHITLTARDGADRKTPTAQDYPFDKTEPAITSIGATIVQEKLRLDWDAPLAQGASIYLVEILEQKPDGSFKLVQEDKNGIANTSTTWESTVLDIGNKQLPGTTYKFRVHAYDAAGNRATRASLIHKDGSITGVEGDYTWSFGAWAVKGRIAIELDNTVKTPPTNLELVLNGPQCEALGIAEGTTIPVELGAGDWDAGQASVEQKLRGVNVSSFSIPSGGPNEPTLTLHGARLARKATNIEEDQLVASSVTASVTGRSFQYANVRISGRGEIQGEYNNVNNNTPFTTANSWKFSSASDKLTAQGITLWGTLTDYTDINGAKLSVTGVTPLASGAIDGGVIGEFTTKPDGARFKVLGAKLDLGSPTTPAYA